MRLEFQKFVSLQSRMATLQYDWHTDLLLFIFVDQTTACLSYSCSSADFPSGRYLERQWMCIPLNLKCLPPSMCPMPVLVPWSNGLVFLNISLLREIMQLHYLYRSLPLGCGEKKKTTVRDHLHLRICTEIYIRACLSYFIISKSTNWDQFHASPHFISDFCKLLKINPNKLLLVTMMQIQI